MKTRKSTNRLLMAMVIVCCCQLISTGLAAKTSKTKNSTVTAKELTATTKHPKIVHKVKVTTTTTSTTSTTEKPELEITTLPNVDLDLDGRSAFINNQYVSDAELTVQDTSSPLYELIQKQMETVLANKGGKLELYRVNSPQMKESLDELTQKPLFAYDVAQFDDYDEEEDTSEEYMPDNCEDTQENLKDNDSSGNQQQQNLLSNYGQPLEDSTQLNQLQQAKPNKPYDSSNYGPQTAQGTSSTYNSGQNVYIHQKPNNKATQKPQATKTKPSSYQQSSNAYGQAKPSEQNTQKDPETKDENSNKQQQSTNQKPQQISYNTPKPSSTKPPTQHSKTKPIYTTNLNQKLQTSTFQNSAIQNNQNFTNLQPTNPYISRLPSLITSAVANPSLTSNFLYGSANTPSLSPFSSTSTSTTSGTAAQQKRHLTFRTVASSTQYVSSPLADLMFKFSIGMAKPANSNSIGNNPAQIYNLINDQ